MVSHDISYPKHINNPDRTCTVVAHRGNWQAAPENSLPAIEQAIQDGCHVVEIDIRRSADGEFFLLHDDTLERMAGIDRVAEELTSMELANLRLRNRDGGRKNEMTSAKLPNLKEVFELTRDRIYIHLDIKDRDLLPQVMACARAMGVDQQVDYWGDLRTERDLVWIRKTVEPHNVFFMAKTRLNTPDVATQLDLLFELSPPMCEVYFDNLEQVAALHQRAQEAGIALWYNTLDEVSCGGFTDTAAVKDPEAIWGRLLDAGISVIQTDQPTLLIEFISTRGRKNVPARSDIKHASQ